MQSFIVFYDGLNVGRSPERNPDIVKNMIKHVKRYSLLGAIAIMPIALAVFLFSFLYDDVVRQADKLFPSLNRVFDVGVFAVATILFLYFLGIILSYFLGKKVQNMSQKWTDFIPQVKSIKDELDLAKKIHESIIPPSRSTQELDISVNYIPCQSLGGDFATYHFYNEKEVVFVIADVTGHGIAQALLVNRLYTEIERFILEKQQPGVLLKKADQFVQHSFQDTNMFTSAFCCFLDLKTMTMVYSNYGHLPQYLCRNQDRQIIELKSQTTLLGIGKNTQNVFQEQVQIYPHDRLMLFTDGISETQGGWKRERYGCERLKKELKEGMGHSLPEFQEAFLKKVWRFTEEEYEDDVCLMCIGVK